MSSCVKPKRFRKNLNIFRRHYNKHGKRQTQQQNASLLDNEALRLRSNDTKIKRSNGHTDSSYYNFQQNQFQEEPYSKNMSNSNLMNATSSSSFNNITSNGNNSSNSSTPSSSTPPPPPPPSSASLQTQGSQSKLVPVNGVCSESTQVYSTSGHLQKWTNYLKGYQKRWFVLNNGLLSYYRSQAEMAHTCRGTIKIANASIINEDACHFVITNSSSGTQTFHLKAASEADKEKWISAIKIAKEKAKQCSAQDSDDEDEDANAEQERNEIQSMMKKLQQKLEDLNTCNDLVQKYSNALSKSLVDLENLQARPDESVIKQINERATVYKITLMATNKACQEYTSIANLQCRKMQKVLQSEREIRAKLEDMVQDMAKTQSNIETQISSRRSKRKDGTLTKEETQSHQEKIQEQQQNKKSSHTISTRNLFEQNDENDEDDIKSNDEFHDALEDVIPVIMPKQQQAIGHQRKESNLSKISLEESDVSTDTDDTQQRTIQVKMHKDSQQVAVTLASNELVPLKQQLKVRSRRKEIPLRPNYSLNLWGIMKNCIGKDLSKIPIPVNFSEPLSMLQRIIEELEYSELLDKASSCTDQWEQMAYVAAFTISAYSTTATRTNKPFNPILGETYECDRFDEQGYGWRAISEQVSHHPPGLAVHCESIRQWELYQEFTMSSKFRGQYLQINPTGTSHLEFKKTGHHYTWRKVTTFVRNIIVGKLWIDNVGEMDIINHKTKDICHLKYFPYSYFSRDVPRKVTGIITDSNNIARYVLNGTWTEQIEGMQVLNPQVVSEDTKLQTGPAKLLWKRKYPPPQLESMYNFTELAVELNELEDGVAPTDTRLRPDQRLMEQGNWDEANREKLRLEEKQRVNRKQRESLNEQLANENKPPIDYNPLWFKKSIDPYTNEPIHVSNREYWNCKQKSDWKRCPDLF